MWTPKVHLVSLVGTLFSDAAYYSAPTCKFDSLMYCQETPNRKKKAYIWEEKDTDTKNRALNFHRLTAPDLSHCD